ncbi:MAG: hypothetical protein K0B09_14975 [Bacteroidales bacterium]|nr:hypothetical protein [Bacteroidales bacterium]
MLPPEPRFYKISEVSSLWNKSKDEVLMLVENSSLEVLCRYEGHYFEAGPGRQAGCFYTSVDGITSGWYRVPAEAASSIRLCGMAELIELTSYWSIYDVSEEEFLDSDLMNELNSNQIWPAVKTEYNGRPAWEWGTYKIGIEDLVFSNLALCEAEIKCPELVRATTPPSPPQGNQGKVPDKKKSTLSSTTKPDNTLTQAIKRLFLYLYENGEHDTLKKTNINVFTNKMRTLCSQSSGKTHERDTEISEYLAERIEWVKNVGTRPTIKTKQYDHPRKSGSFKPEKSIIYNKQDIEKRLKPLRERYSISD